MRLEDLSASIVLHARGVGVSQSPAEAKFVQGAVPSQFEKSEQKVLRRRPSEGAILVDRQ